MRFIRLYPICLLVFLIVFSCSTSAVMLPKDADNKFLTWVERLKKQAFAKGISTVTIEEVFSRVEYIPNTTAMPNPSHENARYLSNALGFNYVRLSKQILNHYSDLLFEIKHLFGVDEEIIISVWRIDNQTNSPKDQISAISVLSSQLFIDQNNSEIENELFQALKIIDEGLVHTDQLISDLSGRLGATHFAPTEFRNFAIDYDGDGNFDLWENHPDIFASTANFLSTIGWTPGQSWGYEIKLPPDFNPNYIDINSQRSVNKWQAMGIRLTDDSDLPVSSDMASVIHPVGSFGRYYLVFDNYFALLRWKRSPEFALAVGLMSDLIKDKNRADPVD